MICYESKNYRVCHGILREGDEVSYGGDKVILETFKEDWSVKIIRSKL